MSRFNKENVAHLAQHAFRLRIDDSMEERRKAELGAPLLGKERKLLAPLQNAEKTYEEWLVLGPIRSRQQRLISKFPHHSKRLRGHLQRVLACWSEMHEYGGQYELACRVTDASTTDDSHDLVRRIDDTLRQLLLGARSGSTDKTFSYIGRPDGSLAALGEFTKVVRSFWIDETSERFGYDEETTFNNQKDGRREATSAAARLVEGAAKILHPQFDLGKVREVMEAVNRDPHLF
jgi:hypothetical protein